MSFNKKIISESVLALFAGGGIIYLVYILLDKATLFKLFPDNRVESIIFYSSLILAPFSGLVIHETGHLFAGLFQGFRLEFFVAGLFGLKRDNNKIKVFLNTNVQHFGGIAATSPRITLPDNELIDKFKLILVCGPVASVIYCIVTLSIFYFTDTLLNPFFGLAGITSFGLFLVTTLPKRSGIFFTDRKRYQRLNDKGDTGKAELAFLQITNQSLLDGNCKNLALDKIHIIKNDSDKIMQFWGYYFEFQHYKDIDNDADAEKIKLTLQNYKKLMPGGIWKSLQIES